MQRWDSRCYGASLPRRRCRQERRASVTTAWRGCDRVPGDAGGPPAILRRRSGGGEPVELGPARRRRARARARLLCRPRPAERARAHARQGARARARRGPRGREGGAAAPGHRPLTLPRVRDLRARVPGGRRARARPRPGDGGARGALSGDLRLRARVSGGRDHGDAGGSRGAPRRPPRWTRTSRRSASRACFWRAR